MTSQNILNAELDSILKDSETINNMSPTELLALSERVDGTLRQLENIAEKRLGVRMDMAKHNRKERSPQEEEVQEEQQQGAAPVGQGLLAGLTGLGGGNSNLMQMLTNLFSSLGGGGGQRTADDMDMEIEE
jgi:hypothetical protein